MMRKSAALFVSALGLAMFMPLKASAQSGYADGDYDYPRYQGRAYDPHYAQRSYPAYGDGDYDYPRYQGRAYDPHYAQRSYPAYGDGDYDYERPATRR